MLFALLIPQEMVDNNVGPDYLEGPKALTSKQLQTTNHWIA